MPDRLTGGASRKPRLAAGLGRAIMSGSFLAGKPRPGGGELQYETLITAATKHRNPVCLNPVMGGFPPFRKAQGRELAERPSRE